LHRKLATAHGEPVLIRRESQADAAVIRAITDAAFAPVRQAGQTTPAQATPAQTGPAHATAEAWLVGELRAGPAWLPALSLVATTPGGDVIGHVLCTRGHVGPAPVLALGPLTVRPDQQRRGVGSALMHAVLGAAEALGEPLVVLLGDPGYYHRFGFRLTAEYQITPPDPGWHAHFQVRALTAYTPSLRGAFAYPDPFNRWTAQL
jgi:putative acetyltransferase